MKLVLSTLVFQTSHFICNLFGCKLWLQSIQNHCDSWHCFQAVARSHLKLLCCSKKKSEQMPFPRTGHLCKPAALHRVLLGTSSFVPMSYFYSETNDRWKDWAKLWAALGAALVGNNLSPISLKFSFHMKKMVTCGYPKFTKHENLVDSWTE